MKFCDLSLILWEQVSSYLTIADADIESLKFHHTLFDK